MRPRESKRGRKREGRRTVNKRVAARLARIQLQELIGSVDNRANARDEIRSSSALFGDYARQLPPQPHVDGQIGLHLDIVKRIESVRVTIPVAQRVAGADR